MTKLKRDEALIVQAPVTAERYKDELNFAEFPLAALTEDLSDDVKTLTFIDTIFDQGTRQPVTRKLTISASDKYGLPRAKDEEVVLGLIQLSNRQGFADRKVHFSSYELIKILGWNDSAKSYRRIEESLKRWLGVTLYYDRAWWSKEEESWVNEHFHVLENVTIFDRSRRDAAKKQNREDPNAGKSSFVWNESVFRSFKAEHLKHIDLQIYRSLKTPTAKRVFRFLDKRFYHRSHLEFDLANFAYEHIGLARTNPLREAKRILQKACLELEAIGFLKAADPAARFTMVKKGVWKIAFDKGASEAQSLMSAEEIGCLEELKARGVTPSKASRLVRDHGTGKVSEKIALHDWLRKSGDARCSANPAGFLVAAIQKDFPLPANFLKSRSEQKASLRLSQQPTARPAVPVQAEPPVPSEAQLAFQRFWDELADDAKELFERDAVDHADRFSRRRYDEGREGNGPVFRAVREKILRDEFERKVTV